VSWIRYAHHKIKIPLHCTNILFFFQLGANMTLLFGAIVPEDQWEGLFEVWDIEHNMKMLVRPEDG
jgi:hypothetical protein